MRRKHRPQSIGRRAALRAAVEVRRGHRTQTRTDAAFVCVGCPRLTTRWPEASRGRTSLRSWRLCVRFTLRPLGSRVAPARWLRRGSARRSPPRRSRRPAARRRPRCCRARGTDRSRRARGRQAVEPEAVLRRRAAGTWPGADGPCRGSGWSRRGRTRCCRGSGGCRPPRRQRVDVRRVLVGDADAPGDRAASGRRALKWKMNSWQSFTNRSLLIGL